MITSNTRTFALIGGPMDGKPWRVTMERFFWPDEIRIMVPKAADLLSYVPGAPIQPEDFETATAHRYVFTPFRADVPNCLHLRTFVFVHSDHELCESDVDAQLERWGLI